MHALILLALLGCRTADDASDDDSDSETTGDSGTTDTGNTDTGEEEVGDGTELVLLGYLGEATVTATTWSGTEAMRAVSADEGVERCRFEWTTTGEPHSEAASCDGCAFAHEVTLSNGAVVGRSCDWLFDANGPPPAEGGTFPYAFHEDFDGNGPALLYFYVDRWIELPSSTATYDASSGALTYEVAVGEDYF